jgi:2-amino-4-hydroxy-6-hydroxymethyldihydropteridine diphosphokinase
MGASASWASAGARGSSIWISSSDNETIEKRNLKVPHPRLPQRRFVLVPLSELAPQLIHPGLNASVSELLATTKDTKKIHMMGSSD